MKTYRIQIDLPEGSDEFWEEIELLKKPEAKRRIAMDLESWLAQGGWLDATVKVTEVIER